MYMNATAAIRCIQRKEPDAAAGTFRGGGHQALLQRVGSGQIIRHNNKVDAL